MMVIKCVVADTALCEGETLVDSTTEECVHAEDQRMEYTNAPSSSWYIQHHYYTDIIDILQ